MAYQLGRLNSRPCDKPPYTCPYEAKSYKECKGKCGRSENTALFQDLMLEQLEQMG